MPHYLYIFGFNTPEQIEDWEKHRWDAEDSEAAFIEASSEAEALAWGREVSREFVRRLYGTQGLNWRETDYANWIEAAPETTFSPADLFRICIIRVGEHPRLDGDRFALRENPSA